MGLEIGQVAPILTAVGTLIAAVQVWRKSRRTTPLEVETATVVNAKTAGDLALSIAKQAQEQVHAQFGRLDEMQRQLDDAAARIDALEGDRGTLVEWIKTMLRDWGSLRRSPNPPPPPPIAPWH